MTAAIVLPLAECEAVIERGLATFIDVGNALLRIRDERLYRAEYRDFETYCQARWSMSRPRAYQLIAAADVAGKLSTNVDTPTTEAQARELAKLKDNPEAMNEVWATAQGITNGNPTAKVISDVRDRLHPAAPKPTFSDADLDDAPLTDEECQALDNPRTPIPAPEAKQPVRKPLPEAFWQATFDMGKEVKRLERLAADDRFTRNADQIGEVNLPDLIRARDALQSVIDQLSH